MRIGLFRLMAEEQGMLFTYSVVSFLNRNDLRR